MTTETGPWGIYDTKDNLWLGDDNGPKRFAAGDVINGKTLTDEEAHFFARCAAEAACFTLKWKLHRAQARPLPKDGPWTLRDEVAKERTELEWLQKKERGVIL